MTDAQKPITFRRRIVVAAHDNVVRGALEDDFHHFEIELTHDGRVITGAQGRAVRTPWNTCPGALERLRDFVGTPLSTAVHVARNLPDSLQHCTHWFDLAVVAVAQAARGGRRQYDMTVPPRLGGKNLPKVGADGTVTMPPGKPIDGKTRPEIRRDGELLFHWDIESETIVGPEPFAGLTLRGLSSWAARHDDSDQVEAVLLLRRAAYIAAGRALPFHLLLRATQHPQLQGACYVFQASRMDAARRNVEATLDFTETPDVLLKDFAP